MNLHPDDEAVVLSAIRLVPESTQDDAWKYAADRLRPIHQPTPIDIREITNDLLLRYRGRE